MRRWLVQLTVAGVVSLAAAAPALGATAHVTVSSASAFPERTLAMTLASREQVSASEVSVSENGAPVEDLTVRSASALGHSRFGTVLLIDTSGSMHGRAIRSALAAAISFVRQRNPAQPVGIVFFSATARVVVPLTTDSQQLADALATTPRLGAGTHIFDATQTAIAMLAQKRLAGGSIVLLSDGQDSGSRASERSLADAAAAKGIRVYAVGVRDRAFQGQTLQSLAAATHGTYEPVVSSQLPALYQRLGVELSNEYVLRYRSVASLGHLVRVVVRVPGFSPAVADYAAPPLPSSSPTRAARPDHSFWGSSVAAALASLLCAVLLGVAVLLLVRRPRSVRDRIGDFVTEEPISERARHSAVIQRALGDRPGRRRRVDRGRLVAALAAEMDVAAITLEPVQLVVLSLLGCVVVGWVFAALTGSVVGALLGVLVPVAARVAVRHQATRQRRKFDEQLPENLQVIASALRAGHTFAGSLSVVVEDAPEPSRRELRRALSDEQLGVPLVDTLEHVADRMHSSDFRHVALVARLQRDTGGNTAEVLDVVTDTIRDRLDLRRIVRTLTAQGRLAGGILSLLPLALLLAVALINPNYIHPLFHQTLGVIALAIAAVMVLSGGLVIRRIVDIDV